MSRLQSFFFPFVLFLLLLVAAGLAQGPRSAPPFGPTVWSAYLFNNLDPRKVPAGLLSSFTPFGDITVTRIEAVVGDGPRVRGTLKSEMELQHCSVPPAIKVTNGSVSYTLPFSEPAQFPPDKGSSTDSGPLELRLPSNTRIDLVLVPGSPPVTQMSDTTYCYVGDVNITVQYRTH